MHHTGEEGFLQPKDETNSHKTQVLTEAFDNYFLILKGVG